MIENATIHSNSINKDYRIIKITDDKVYIIPISDGSSKISNFSIEDFAELIETLEFESCIDPFHDPPDKITPKQIERCERNFQIISKFWEENWEDILNGKMKACIRKFVEDYKNNPTDSSKKSWSFNGIRNLLKRFLKGGRTKHCLLPKFDQIYQKSYEERSINKRPGKKTNESYIPSIYLYPIYEKYYNKCYLDPQFKKDLSKVYEKILKDLFRNEDKTTSKYIKEEPTDFYRWARKQDKSKVDIIREGAKDYSNNKRLMYGNARRETSIPGQIYEIDSTKLDLETLMDIDRDKSIGTLEFTIIIDVETHFIPSFKISVNDESYTEIMDAFINLADPVSLFEKYGVKVNESDYPSKGVLPLILRGDNGPLKSTATQNFTQEFGIAIQRHPPYNPVRKGTVEGVFNEFNVWCLQNIEGGKWKRILDRGDKDPKLLAKLIKSEAERFVAQLIDDHNKTRIKNFVLSPGQIEAGIDSSPLELWNYGSKKCFGQFKRLFNKRQARLRLLPRKSRVIQKTGITWNKKEYATNKSPTGPFMNKNIGNKVEIVYDPSDIGLIWIKNGNELLPVPLKDNYEGFSGMSINISQLYDEVNKNTQKEHQSEQNKIKDDQILRFETLQKNNKEYQAPETKIKRRGNIKENRRIQRDHDHQMELNPLPLEIQNPETPSTPIKNDNANNIVRNSILKKIGGI